MFCRTRKKEKKEGVVPESIVVRASCIFLHSSGARGVVGIVGHEISSVEVGREDEGRAHYPLHGGKSLGLRLSIRIITDKGGIDRYGPL